MKPPVALAKSYARWLAKRYDKVFVATLPTLLDGWDRNPVHFSGRVPRADASDYVNKVIRKLVHTFDEHPIDSHAVTGLGTKVAAENAKHLRVAGIPNVGGGESTLKPEMQRVLSYLRHEAEDRDLAEGNEFVRASTAEIAEGTGLDERVVFRLMDQAEKKGYVTRGGRVELDIDPRLGARRGIGKSEVGRGKGIGWRSWEMSGEQYKLFDAAAAPATGGISTAARIAQFRDNNLALIKSLDSEAVDRLRTLLEQAEKDAARVETLRAQIIEAFGSTRSHADLIARDQVLKLNGQITEDRQTGAGITQYTWSTSGDERVRPGHEELDGTIQAWASPPEVDEKSGRRGHPGSGDYQCRCVAIPVL